MLNIDEYFDLPDRPGFDYELIGGRLAEMHLPPFLNGEVQALTSCALTTLTWESFPEFEVACRTGFLLSGNTNLGPDVVMIRREAREKMEVYRGSLKGAPDLAVEIVSPSESAEDVDEKVEAYLAAGTKTVLVVWPKTRHVMAHHSDGSVAKAGPGQHIEAPEVLPGVRIAVDSLFPAA